MLKAITFLFIFFLAGTAFRCSQPERVSELDFRGVEVYGNAGNMWARVPADIDGDGLLDIVFTDNNAYGGWLGWLQSEPEMEDWALYLIADSTTVGATLAGGDIAAADINGSGKTDIVSFLHPGEWDQADAPSQIYWFENPNWTAHHIGEAPAFVKDVEVADFNADGRPDLALITFERNSFQVFAQDEEGWYEAVNMTVPNLHEGMAAGDIDGDGYPDIATNGYWIKSPGADLRESWVLQSIDEKWHNQTGDWARNATKVFCADIDGDGRREVFISHSESKGYPLSYYKLLDASGNTWEEVVIDYIDGCHSLQVADFNGDGLPDVLAGENQMRWNNEVAPVNIYLNTGDHRTFTKVTITEGGCYNCLAADLAGNGRPDIIRLSGHSATQLEVWINETSQP